MQQYFNRGETGLSVATMSVPQLEAVSNFIAGIKHPGDDFYSWERNRKLKPSQTMAARIDAILRDYACEFYFPVRSAGIRSDHKRAILSFLKHYRRQQRIRPPLPNHCKLFMESYFHYRQRAQVFFDEVGFPVKVEYLALAMIEALLNFMVGDKFPEKEGYRRVFIANRMRPVDFFIKMYKPYENPRYPISVGQYHGRRQEITPLLYFKPAVSVPRWFEPPNSTKIKQGRRRLFLNYRVIFNQYGLGVAPTMLPIAYVEAVLNYAQVYAAKQSGVIAVQRAC
jgi:hypothetical protein